MFSPLAAVAALKPVCRPTSTLIFIRFVLSSAIPVTSCSGPAALEVSIYIHEYRRIKIPAEGADCTRQPPPARLITLLS